MDPAEDLAEDLPAELTAPVTEAVEVDTADDVAEIDAEGDVDEDDEDDDEDEDEDEEHDDQDQGVENLAEESVEEQPPGGEPELPDDVDPRDLDPEVRSELRTLTGQLNTLVGKRLVASGMLLDEDPAGALAHALVARRLAPRVASVREAVGLAAYHTGQWAMAVAELRTYHRIAGRQTHLAVIADCERAQGRPAKAVDLYRAANLDKLEPDEAIELLIVAAGARGDMGQFGAAVAMLQVPDLQDDDAPWAARLRYAYADSLLAAGRTADARDWFARAADVDEDLATDAAERLLELDGVVIDDPADPVGVAGPASPARVPEVREPTSGADDSAPAGPHVGHPGQTRGADVATTRPGHALIFTEPPTTVDGPDGPDPEGFEAR